MVATGQHAGATISYSAPLIEDYGSLIDLTASFDPEMVASLAKGAGTLSLAVVSTVVPGGEILPGTDSSPPGTGVLGEGESGDGSGPGAGDGAGGTRGVQGSGGGSSGGGAEGAGPGSETGGRLPFSGYGVLVTAAVGAALASAGAGARSALRRRRT